LTLAGARKLKDEAFPFKCGLCGRIFKLEADLKQHLEMRLHFQCDRCRRRFHTAGGLEDHALVLHPLILVDRYSFNPASKHLYCPVCYRHKTAQHYKQANQVCFLPFVPLSWLIMAHHGGCRQSTGNARIVSNSSP